VDILHPVAQPAEAFLDTLVLAGTRFTTSELTRVTHTTATCINIIAVNEDIKVNRSEVLITASSVHYPVTTVITFLQPDKVKPVVKRSFSSSTKLILWN